jgi:hypothetical protein
MPLIQSPTPWKRLKISGLQSPEEKLLPGKMGNHTACRRLPDHSKENNNAYTKNYFTNQGLRCRRRNHYAKVRPIFRVTVTFLRLEKNLVNTRHF